MTLKIPTLILVALLTQLTAVDFSAANEKCNGQSLVLSTFGEHNALEENATSTLTKAYHSIGCQFTLKKLPGLRALVESNAGRTDGELIRKDGLNVEYPNLIQVKVPVTTISLRAFSAKKEIVLKNNWQSLEKYSIAYERGTIVIEKNLRKAAKLQTVDNIKASFLALKRGRLDIVLIDKSSGIKLIKELELEKDIFIIPSFEVETKLYHYLHKKNVHLVEPLEKALLNN